jgi:hypothetical protein
MKTKPDTLDKHFISRSIEEWGLDNLLNSLLEKLRYFKSAPSTLDEALLNRSSFLNLKEVLEKQPTSSSKTIIMDYLDHAPYFERDYIKIAHMAYELSLLHSDNHLYFDQDDIYTTTYSGAGRIHPDFLKADTILNSEGVSFTTQMIPEEHKSVALLLKEILDHAYWFGIGDVAYSKHKVDFKIIFPDMPPFLLKEAVTISFTKDHYNPANYCKFSFYFKGRQALNKELKTLYQKQIGPIP